MFVKIPSGNQSSMLGRPLSLASSIPPKAPQLLLWCQSGFTIYSSLCLPWIPLEMLTIIRDLIMHTESYSLSAILYLVTLTPLSKNSSPTAFGQDCECVSLAFHTVYRYLFRSLGGEISTWRSAWQLQGGHIA